MEFHVENMMEYIPKPSIVQDIPQTKTTAESGDGEEAWLTSYLSIKGSFILIDRS